MLLFIAFILISVIIYYGYRSLKREVIRMSQQLHQAKQEAKTKAHGTLLQDPKTGEYHVHRD